MKQPVLAALPLDGRVRVLETRNSFARIDGHGFVFLPHLAPLDVHAADAVTVAETLIGVPYLWGGKSAAGYRLLGARSARLLRRRSGDAARHRYAARHGASPCRSMFRSRICDGVISCSGKGMSA